jgi:uncharacterized protein
MVRAWRRSVARVSNLHQRLRDDLTAALRAQDRELVRVLRTVLSAIANAEAQPHEAIAPRHPEGAIAGAALGVGASEVARRDLAAHDVLAIVRSERDERLDAAEVLASLDRHDVAERLRAAAAVLDDYLP